jgi:hypothetical protein
MNKTRLNDSSKSRADQTTLADDGAALHIQCLKEVHVFKRIDLDFCDDIAVQISGGVKKRQQRNTKEIQTIIKPIIDLYILKN